ncbi:MAG TPA: carboxypeptidase-like regulatory domain-containing protein [Kofleriaceae bacterium]|nr:carboxypeptidase-like regulatory domain-containing protein [Kofleriaceae bacterium]
MIAPFLILGACGGDDGTCDPVAQSGCDDGKVCEQVSGGQPACFAPVELHGKVLDLADAHGIAGAHIVAVDVNGAAVTSVATSGTDGSYTLTVPAQRASDGTPAAFPVALRADAAGYQAFPGTVRTALPIDVASATAGDGGYIVQSALTDIGLLAEAGAPAGQIHGKVALPSDGAGVLVVAETGGKGSSAIVSRDGEYTVFNLAAGHYTVTAYAVDHVYQPAETDVADSPVALDLALASDAPGMVTGQVSIVNGGGASATSVVAFIESTFDPKTGRGVAPPGLRAPRTGTPDVTGAFTIDGVPPGRYVIVAAFENDGLVRDPDHCIAGTADVHVEVTAGQTVATPTAFKVTGALAVISPGADAADTLTSAPNFQWEDDSSEDLYLVEVFDAFGVQKWMATMKGISSGTPAMAYAGPGLQPGMYYQWRVTSSHQKPSGTEECELSRSEDLRGVFLMQ